MPAVIALPHLAPSLSLALWIISASALLVFAGVNVVDRLGKPPRTLSLIAAFAVLLVVLFAASTVYAFPIPCTGWECIPWAW